MTTTVTTTDRPMTEEAWRGFVAGPWQDGVDVRDFIQRNYTPYTGDAGFLAGPTARTTALWERARRRCSRPSASAASTTSTPHTPGTITSHAPGYIDADQRADRRVCRPTPRSSGRSCPTAAGGWSRTRSTTYGYEVDPTVEKIFTTYRKTHNDGVFDVYPPAVKAARRSEHHHRPARRLRPRPDHRRLPPRRALRRRRADRGEGAAIAPSWTPPLSTEDVIRDREEIAEQIRALGELKEMAASYGFDISGPAGTAQRGGAVALLRLPGARSRSRTARRCRWAAPRPSSTSTSQRDLDAGLLTEQQAQELIDDLVIKLRIVRFLRTPEYDALFSGDPTWVTESIGGMGDDGRTLVTRTSFRMPADPLQPRAGPGAEPDRAVERPSCPRRSSSSARRCRSTPRRSSTSPTT